MFKSFCYFVMSVGAAACLPVGISTVQADELFSRFSIDSVFSGTPSSATAAPDRPEPLERGRKVLGVDQLQDLLRDTGLEPQLEGDKLVTINLQHARWTFPVTFGLTENRD